MSVNPILPLNPIMLINPIMPIKALNPPETLNHRVPAAFFQPVPGRAATQPGQDLSSSELGGFRGGFRGLGGSGAIGGFRALGV